MWVSNDGWPVLGKLAARTAAHRCVVSILGNPLAGTSTAGSGSPLHPTLSRYRKLSDQLAAANGLLMAAEDDSWYVNRSGDG